MKHYTYEEICAYLFTLIPQNDFERNKGKLGELCREFAGFVDTYYYLSQIIPKEYTVIDFGAGYNAQSYFFIEHEKYIAINPYSPVFTDDGMLCAPNCDIYRMTTGDFLNEVDYPKENVFAICNFVPNWHGEDSIKLVQQHFRNVYTFYP